MPRIQIQRIAGGPPSAVVRTRGCGTTAVLLFAILLTPCAITAADQESESAAAFENQIRPLLRRYCGECHAGEVTEADIDFGAFRTLDEVKRRTDVWLKVRGMLESDQMPPKEAPQPTDEAQRVLRTWVRGFLAHQAKATAGDPGPITLRRLNNHEYNYTVRDLTGIASLDPTREFPVDGAAGEGFINTGSAQSMSPSFVTKYLGAAKEVASHVVLLPDGIRFSPHATRRDQTDELVARIQAFYRDFTVDGGVVAVDLPGISFDINRDGLLPVQKYLAATLEERAALADGTKTISAVADARSLNAKYLGALWRALSSDPTNSDSILVDDLRRKWLHATPKDADKLAAEVKRAQQQLWKFNSVGQLTVGGKQKVWMQPISPIVSRQELRLPLPPANDAEIVVHLAANDLGDGRDHDFVVWQRPRLEFKPDPSGVAHPPLLLRDIHGLGQRTSALIATELQRTARYLDAVAKLHASQATADDVARAGRLNAKLLANWAEIIGLNRRRKRELTGHFTSTLTRAQGYADVNGWGTPQTPNVLSNRSNDAISFLTLTIPAKSIVVHPSPTQESVVAWRSPFTGKVKLEGLVADADDKCGNGAAWRVELRTESGEETLARGTLDNGRKAQFRPNGEFQVSRGDLVSLIVNARDKSHVCDTTHVDLTLSEVGGDKRKWNLAADVVDRILEANPLPDSYGNAETWHLCAADDKVETKSAVIPGSTIARWRAAVLTAAPAAEIERLAVSAQDVLTSQDPGAVRESDRALREQLRDWKGPLRWLTVARDSKANTPGESRLPNDALPRFGKHPNGSAIDAASLCVQAPEVIELRMPTALVAGAEFVVSGELHPATGDNGTVQLQVSLARPRSHDISTSLPLLVGNNGAAKSRLEAALADFRNLFPAALCYARIVPVDEVVTMTLYFREDEHLRRLMLNEAQIAELDRLWDELFYVAQEPIALTVAFEQIYEFATQDRPDLVKAFGPMRKPINDRADVFRKRLLETEPAHLDAVLEFADRAWRRPLTSAEQAALREFYQQLRASGMAHDDSVRLLLARCLTSPAFLYRREQPAGGKDAAPVKSSELASRVSYFLWSSLPDASLREAADSGRLVDDAELIAQTRRMLKDTRARRLAIQFACQWLHLRDFDQNDDKNEQMYPEFAALRHDMYEETVRFLEDMFRNNGSILGLLNADHTFLNEALARHYGIDGVTGPEMRRVDGIGRRGRGGIFGMASFLASQSGASRTSPILRGNWIYETLLGQRLPRPPPTVPQLPERIPDGLTARQLIERHSSAAACAKCHVKIDPYGFALEQYDAIGRLRPTPVDTRTKLESGEEITGIDGLRSYLLNQRRDDVVRQFCRKLLGFALGREVQLSDELLLDSMVKKLGDNDYRVNVAIEAIIHSDQFRNVRGTADGLLEK